MNAMRFAQDLKRMPKRTGTILKKVRQKNSLLKFNSQTQTLLEENEQTIQSERTSNEQHKLSYAVVLK